ncbi:hypothetical protein Cgig2_003658 [Carnegiea gigantea]|uniref:Uncharacterized protein n=1 Tax=Carnegiea gigantea TaxID=171969 RepID=A0A9Q1GW54_9CARY|nr:hypothetical protein Cgig2_003658 [Carnegiea gigantea]
MAEIPMHGAPKLHPEPYILTSSAMSMAYSHNTFDHAQPCGGLLQLGTTASYSRGVTLPSFLSPPSLPTIGATLMASNVTNLVTLRLYTLKDFLTWHIWPIVPEEVCQAILGFFQTRKLLREWNATRITVVNGTTDYELNGSNHFEQIQHPKTYILFLCSHSPSIAKTSPESLPSSFTIVPLGDGQETRFPHSRTYVSICGNSKLEVTTFLSFYLELSRLGSYTYLELPSQSCSPGTLFHVAASFGPTSAHLYLSADFSASAHNLVYPSFLSTPVTDQLVCFL